MFLNGANNTECENCYFCDLMTLKKKPVLIVRNFVRVNQAMFSSTSNIDSYASGKEVVSVKLPSISSVERSQDEHSEEPVNASQPKNDLEFPIQDKQIPELVTLSLLPKSQWQNLINLDIIKVLISQQQYCIS